MLALESATLGALVAIVRDGVDSGQFRDVEPRTTAAFPLAAADGLRKGNTYATASNYCRLWWKETR